MTRFEAAATSSITLWEAEQIALREGHEQGTDEFKKRRDELFPIP